MKICIYGAGAIGGYLGVMLSRTDAEISLVARGGQLAAIRENGLRLDMGGETSVARLTATSDPAELGPQDFVIVALKAHQAWEVAEAMTPLLGPETAVVTAQNGVPWWYFYGFEGHTRICAWKASTPATASGTPSVRSAPSAAPSTRRRRSSSRASSSIFTATSSAWASLPARRRARAPALGAVFEAGGLKAPVMPEIRNDIWLKLWGNLCFNPISALTRATLDVVATDPGTRALSRNMMLEAEKIGRRIGVHFRVDVERRINGAAPCRRPPHLHAAGPGARAPLEIDALLTVVQEMGRMVDVDTPHIDAVLALVQQLGRTQGLYPTYPEEALPETPGAD